MDRETIISLRTLGIALFIIGLLASSLFKTEAERITGYFMIVIGSWLMVLSYLGAHNDYDLEKRLNIVFWPSLLMCFLGVYFWYLLKPDHTLGNIFVAIGGPLGFFSGLASVTMEEVEDDNHAPAES